jgi:hypothetical protein
MGNAKYRIFNLKNNIDRIISDEAVEDHPHHLKTAQEC